MRCNACGLTEVHKFDCPLRHPGVGRDSRAYSVRDMLVTALQNAERRELAALAEPDDLRTRLVNGETTLAGGAVLDDTSNENPLAHSPKQPAPDKLPLTGLDGFRVLLMEAIHSELQGEDSTYEHDRHTGQIAVRFNGHDCWLEVHDGVAPFMRDPEYTEQADFEHF